MPKKTLTADKRARTKRRPAVRAIAAKNGSLTTEMVNALQRSFESDARNRLALNAVTKTSLHDVAKSRRTVTANDHTFSHVLKTGEATSQNKTGRCWLFAGLNPLRGAAIKQMNLDDKFELSQNYLMFWDKLEKANYFLENMIETVKEPVGSRLLDWLLMAPIQDGGQWDMFVNLLKKYGVVPKAVMPETQSSSESRLMNGLITTKLREDACRLREMHAQGAKKPELRAAKENMVEIVYRMLAIHLGEPPEKFLWQWRDKDGEFHRDGIITPQEFLKRHVPSDLESMICMIHCPQKSKRYDTLYTIRYLGNVVDGDIIRYLNVDMPVLKKAAVKMLMDGETVWFGCDVGKMLDRDLGILDIDLYDYDLVYGTTFNFDKAQRLDYGQSQMNHAMVFTGVDLDDKGNPRKWRVENSWGDKIGDKGFLVMSDGWFDEYVYEVAVNRKYIAPKLRSVLKKKPVPLPPWDPMGALAKGE